MTRVCLQFMTQEEADNAVLALSKGYSVNQFATNVSSAGKPYIVNVMVPTSDVYPEED